MLDAEEIDYEAVFCYSVVFVFCCIWCTL